MKGQDAIIQMRMNRKRPEWVFINDYPCSVDWTKYNDQPTICVDGDNIRTLDLRFLVGLQVSVSSTSEKRARELFDACQRHHVSLVAAAHITEAKPHQQNGWTDIWQQS